MWTLGITSEIHPYKKKMKRKETSKREQLTIPYQTTVTRDAGKINFYNFIVRFRWFVEIYFYKFILSEFLSFRILE